MCEQCADSDIMNDYAGESIAADMETYVHEVLQRHPDFDLSPSQVEVNILSKKVKDHVSIQFDGTEPHYLLNFNLYIAYQNIPKPRHVNRLLAKALLYHTDYSIAELSDMLGTAVPVETIHLGIDRPMHLGRARITDRHDIASALDPESYLFTRVVPRHAILRFNGLDPGECPERGCNRTL